MDNIHFGSIKNFDINVNGMILSGEEEKGASYLEEENYDFKNSGGEEYRVVHVGT